MASSNSLNSIGSRRSNGDLGNSAVVQATEGWLELFLTPPEKFAFSQWNEIVRDRSWLGHITKPLLVNKVIPLFVPTNLAPNVMTLAGFLALGQAWYLTDTYGQDYPLYCTILAFFHVCFFLLLTLLTPLHATRIRQSSALSDLFRYSCDNGSSVFLIILTVYCLGGTEKETQWYAVQASQLVLLLKHLSAFRRHAGLRYAPTAGPGEVLLTCLGLLLARTVLGLDNLYALYTKFVQEPVQVVCHSFTSDKECSYELTPAEAVRITYYILWTTAVLQALTLRDPHGWTRFGLTTSLLIRLIPALLLQWGLSFPSNSADVICDGFFVAVLTSDLILAKMANRELHPWVVLMSLAATLSYSTILILVAVYYIAVFSDLCFYLNLPLLAICRNVYCDGVYDLCHIGHKRAFQNALALGNRLYVGVMSDEDAGQYKRPPIMSHDERCAEVQACKAVTKVIPRAPCFGLTPEFLEEHQIHVVAFGEEYLTKYPNPDDDPYYGYARKMNMGVPLPRTNTLSTSDLIARIHKATLEKKSPT